MVGALAVSGKAAIRVLAAELRFYVRGVQENSVSTMPERHPYILANGRIEPGTAAAIAQKLGAQTDPGESFCPSLAAPASGGDRPGGAASYQSENPAANGHEILDPCLWPLAALQLELVNICNYRCPLCRTLRRDGVPRRQMAADEVRRIIDPIGGQLRDVILYGTRGEPLLHPGLEEIIADIKSATGARVSVSTNGSLVDARRAAALLASGLDQIVFAVDGITQETYGQYRVGGNLARVTSNLTGFCDLKMRGGYATRVVLQFIPMAANEHEIGDLAAFGYGLGADVVRLKFSNSVAKSARFRTGDRRYRPAPHRTGRFRCPSGLEKLYVDPNGECYPCCYAEGHRHLSAGNALREDVAAIWHSERMWELRRSFAEQKGFNRFCLDTCRGRAVYPKKILPRPGGAP